MSKHVSTKTFSNDLGLSCCFRQWRATHSHCSLLHGYAIGIHLEFESEELDKRNWVVDFGDFGVIKDYLKNMFDHTTIVAEDDPQLAIFQTMNDLRLIELRIVPNVGCEAFAQLVANVVIDWLKAKRLNDRVKLTLCEVREHGANSAKYLP